MVARRASRQPSAINSTRRRVSRSARAHSALLLPPIPRHKHVSVVTMPPVRSNPYGAFSGRYFPPARLPNVCPSIPAMVSGDPYVPRTRPVRAVLVNADRRPELHYNLRRLHGADPHSKPDERGNEQFAHLLVPPVFMVHADGPLHFNTAMQSHIIEFAMQSFFQIARNR
jgi:hypothetical protein